MEVVPWDKDLKEDHKQLNSVQDQAIMMLTIKEVLLVLKLAMQKDLVMVVVFLLGQELTKLVINHCMVAQK